MSAYWYRCSGGLLIAVLVALLVGCGGGDDAPELQATPEAASDSAAVITAEADGLARVLIGFDSKPGAAEGAIVRGAGGKVTHSYRLIRAAAARIPLKAVEALKKNPLVRYVEADAQRKASEEVLPWGVERIGATAVHASGNKGLGSKVAVIDSGIDDTHLDLSVACVDDGWDFVNNDDDPMDDYGHGTHCAGTIAAADDEDGVIGVAPLAELYALKVLDATGAGYDSDLILAIQWCVTNGIQIASMSMGGPAASTALMEACDAAYNNGQGVLLVAAAGNSGRRNTRFDTVEYPAKYDSVIAVGATDWSNVRPTWSSTGPALELAAPGNNIFSTYLVGAGDPTGFATMSGTSMACPHVSGTAALVMAAGTTSAGQVRAILQETADDLGATGRDYIYGYGLVDAEEAVGIEPNYPPSVAITAPASGSTFSPGATITFTGTASDTEDGDLSGSIAWKSDLDGGFGTGASVSYALSEGVHTITATVTDSGGLSDEAEITVTVSSGSTGQLSVVVVTDKSSYSSGDRAIITATVTDDGAGVEGASVVTVITTPKGKKYTKTGTTNANGVVVFTHNVFTRRDGSGTYSVVATGSKAGYEDASGSTTFTAQ